MTEDKDPMQDAIKILLDRMDAYPEDFMDLDKPFGQNMGYNRVWKIAEMLNNSMRAHRGEKGTKTEGRDPLWFLTDEERLKLFEGMRSVARQTFVTSVMTSLLAPEEDVKEKELLKQTAHTAINSMYPMTGQNALLQQQNVAYTEMTRAKLQAEMARMQMNAIQTGTGISQMDVLGNAALNGFLK